MCILRYKPDQYSKLMPTALFRMEDSIGNPLKSQLYIEFPHVSGCAKHLSGQNQDRIRPDERFDFLKWFVLHFRSLRQI